MTSPGGSFGIFITDADLVVRSWDDWLARVSGISAEEARGRPLTTLLPDLERRGLLSHFRRVLDEGVVVVLSATFHHYLIPCPSQSPSAHFEHMQQRVVIAPLRQDDSIVGIIVTVEDVTEQLERERELKAAAAAADEGTRLRAARALAAEGDAERLVHAMADPSWRVRRAAVDGLVRQADETLVQSVIAALRAEHYDMSVLNSALQVLAFSNVDVVAPLSHLLREQEADVRMYAVLALGERRDRRAIPALLEALSDPDVNVRYHAIEALGRLRAGEAVEALMAIAETRDFFLAFPALDALAHIGDATVAPRIVPLLENDLLRTAAAEALGQLGNADTVPALVGLLNKPGAPTRVIARSLETLHQRYQERFGEGGLIADGVRRAIQPGGVQALLDALEGATEEDLRALVTVLGWLEGAAVERALTRLLGEPSARKEVVEALVRYGTRVTEMLIEQLDAEDLETRMAAVIALGRIGDSRAVPALIRLLDGDDEIVMVTTGALAKIGDRSAMEALLRLLDHPKAAVRLAAVAALNSLGHPDMPHRVAELLRDPDPLRRESAVRIAGYFGYPNCVELLLERCQDEVEAVRCAAVEHCIYLEDERALPAILRALQHDTPRVRAAAARALEHADGETPLPYLLQALQDSDPWVRYYAARSLGRLGYAAALEPLAELARSDTANPVRAAAIEALGHIGGARAAAVLGSLAGETDFDIARTAIEALGNVAHPQALPPLLAALRASDARLRVAALQAIGQHGGGAATGALQWVAASDKDEHVAQAAIQALARLATPEAVAVLFSLATDTTRRDACIAALASLSEAHIPLVADGLHHAHPAARIAAVEALARMKHPRATQALSAALHDEDASVRLAAVNALHYLGSRQAERELVALARSDPDVAVRRAAQSALSAGR